MPWRSRLGLGAGVLFRTFGTSGITTQFGAGLRCCRWFILFLPPASTQSVRQYHPHHLKSSNYLFMPSTLNPTLTPNALPFLRTCSKQIMLRSPKKVGYLGSRLALSLIQVKTMMLGPQYEHHVGTPNFMAPEAVDGKARSGRRAHAHMHLAIRMSIYLYVQRNNHVHIHIYTNTCSRIAAHILRRLTCSSSKV